MLKLILEKVKRAKNPIQFWREKGAQIGDRCEIYSSASLGSEPYLILIGNHVRINANVSFVTHDGGAWVLRDYLDSKDHEKIDLFGTITVGDNVHIGTGSIIMPNVHIGDNTIIGCGSIVTKDIPCNSVAVGVPARVIETLDEYINKNQENFEFTKLLTPEEKKIYLTSKRIKK